MLLLPLHVRIFQSVYVTKVAPEGLAELDGRIHLGDKLLSVSLFLISLSCGM